MRISHSTQNQVFESDESILVRHATADDAQRLCDYYCAQRQHLAPWEPKREASFFTLFGWQKRLVQLTELQRFSLGFYLLIIDLKTDQLCGIISISQLLRFPAYSCQLGYSLAQVWQGKGIMTRALTMACEFLFQQLNMHRIQAAYIPRNLASGRVLTRVGFQAEGIAKQYLLVNGQWEDHQIMALIQSNWSESVAR